MKPLIIGEKKVRVPIVQGGMGIAISLSGLASAVANQGGIGVISAAAIGMTEPDFDTNFKAANKRALIKEIQKAKSLTDGVLGVNIMLAHTDDSELIKTSINEKIDVIFLGAGLPLNVPKTISLDVMKNSSTKFIIKVSSAKAARIIYQYWSDKYNIIPDGIVLEGPLAGGHLGFKKKDLENNTAISLMDLVKQTVEITKPFQEKYKKEIPIIAGGGIHSGKDIYEIMQHGANAVKMGTRFVTTHECDASIGFKNTYINATKKDFEIITSPLGLPGRVIRNNFVDEINSGKRIPFKCPWKCLKTCDFKKVKYCVANSLYNSAQGFMNNGFAFAGAKAYLAKKIQSVKETFEELILEYSSLSFGKAEITV